MTNNWTEQVKFKPWVGDNYHTAPRRVLLLGESHHGDEFFDGFTEAVIRRYCVERQDRHRFFTGIIWTMFGSREDMADKYHMIAFYNYVQRLLPASRVRPRKSDFEAAREPLAEVLFILAPDIVVSFGMDMRRHFPVPADGWAKDIAGESHDVWTNSFVINGRKIPVFSLYHPCAGYFNQQVYYSYFKERGLSLS